MAAYPGGSLYTTETNTILYAIWNDATENNVFVLHFDANRGTFAHGDITNYSPENTYVVELPDETPSRPGYAFLGWSLNPYWNEGDDYYPASSSIILYPGTTTLYAIWSQTSFTITFNPNNGTGGPGVVEASGVNEAQVMSPTSPDPTRDGYTFMGWSKDPLVAVLHNCGCYVPKRLAFHRVFRAEQLLCPYRHPGLWQPLSHAWSRPYCHRRLNRK